MINTIEYFGTGLDMAGHYFHTLTDYRIDENKTKFTDLPFNPESIIAYKPLGTVEYHEFGEFKVCAIEGSCRDRRPGSHSIFWTTNNIQLDEFKDIILSIPIAKKIIEQMPFEVRW